VGSICDVNGKCVYGCMPGQFGDLCNLNCSDDCFTLNLKKNRFIQDSGYSGFGLEEFHCTRFAHLIK
jgi:hypothetical protein